MAVQATLAERLLRRDRTVVLIAIAVIVLLTGLYTVFGFGMKMSAVEMTRMARPIGMPMQMPGVPVWTPGFAVLIFLVWWLMMIAMMTPSAAPTLLLFAALRRHAGGASASMTPVGLFLAGYLAAWAGFSVIAAGPQWLAQHAGVISPGMMTLSSRLLAAAVLVAAGTYQFTPLKQACLRHCRSPAHFLTENRRPGALGALVMGAHHGVYCLGCCWALMALLFVGGIMNLYWIAGLALFVLIEKLLPPGPALSRIGGVVLIMAGLAIAALALG